MSTQTAHQATTNDADDILELARGAGLLVTLDGQIGREKYQSIAGWPRSCASSMHCARRSPPTYPSESTIRAPSDRNCA